MRRMLIEYQEGYRLVPMNEAPIYVLWHGYTDENGDDPKVTLFDFIRGGTLPDIGLTISDLNRNREPITFD